MIDANRQTHNPRAIYKTRIVKIRLFISSVFFDTIIVMTDPINLRQFRKKKQRQDKEKAATQNRAKFGRTKNEKKRDTLNDEKVTSHLDGHRLESSTDDFSNNSSADSTNDLNDDKTD